MKKLLALLLTLIALCVVFTGCSDNKDKGSENNTEITQETGNGGENESGGNGGEGDKTDDGNGENNNEPEHGEVVQPITDGGSFNGGNYD